MYYLICDTFSKGCFELGYVCSEVLKKSSDISELQEMIHEKYEFWLYEKYVISLNCYERGPYWYEDFNEDDYIDEEDYDEDGDLIEGLEYKMFGWPEKPEEDKNYLYVITHYYGEFEHRHYRIISDDNTEFS